jgi:hypothetical protein
MRLALKGPWDSLRDQSTQSVDQLVLAQQVYLCGQYLPSINVESTCLPAMDLRSNGRVDLALVPRLLAQVMKGGEVGLHGNLLSLLGLDFFTLLLLLDNSVYFFQKTFIFSTEQ